MSVTQKHFGLKKTFQKLRNKIQHLKIFCSLLTFGLKPRRLKWRPSFGKRSLIAFLIWDLLLSTRGQLNVSLTNFTTWTKRKIIVRFCLGLFIYIVAVVVVLTLASVNWYTISHTPGTLRSLAKLDGLQPSLFGPSRTAVIHREDLCRFFLSVAYMQTL